DFPGGAQRKPGGCQCDLAGVAGATGGRSALGWLEAATGARRRGAGARRLSRGVSPPPRRVLPARAIRRTATDADPALRGADCDSGCDRGHGAVHEYEYGDVGVFWMPRRTGDRIWWQQRSTQWLLFSADGAYHRVSESASRLI